MHVALKDLTVLLWKVCSSHQTAQAAESRLFQLAIKVPRMAEVRRQCGDMLHTIRFKHWGSWASGGWEICRAARCDHVSHKFITWADEEREKQRKGQYLGFAAIPSLPSTYTRNLWRGEGGHGTKKKSYVIFTPFLKNSVIQEITYADWL